MIFGAIIDVALSISWFFIAAGYNIPNILNGHIGTGADYQLAMLIAGMFMFGWGVILYWGSRNPNERKELLLITAFMLLLSIIIELIFFRHVLEMNIGFMAGAIKRAFIAIIMIAAYTYSIFQRRK